MMYSKSKWLYLSILSLIAAIFGLVHHYSVTINHRWFDWESMFHHEPLIAIALIVGVTLLIVYLSEHWQIKVRRDKTVKGG